MMPHPMLTAKESARRGEENGIFVLQTQKVRRICKRKARLWRSFGGLMMALISFSTKRYVSSSGS